MNHGSKKILRVLVLSAIGSAVTVQAADRTVSVTGTCLRQVTPDRGAIVLNAEVKGPDSKRASAEANRLYERVKEKIQRLRIENLEMQTTEYLVEEIREWEKDRTVSRGYRGRIGLKVSTTNHARLGEVAEAASREGVKDIGRLQLFISPEKFRQERNDCLKEAAEQAKLKAQRLAESLGAKIGEVQSIQETSPEMPAPGPKFMMMEAADARMAKGGAPASIDAGKEDLSVTVNASFSLK